MVETIGTATWHWALTLFVRFTLAFRSSEPLQDIGDSSFGLLAENGGEVKYEERWLHLLLGAKTAGEGCLVTVRLLGWPICSEAAGKTRLCTRKASPQLSWVWGGGHHQVGLYKEAGIKAPGVMSPSR